MWLEKQVSLYECAADNTGKAATFRQILLSEFAVEHEYYYKIYPEDKKAYPKGKWINGTVNDMKTINEIRNSDYEKKDIVLLKQTMQCFTPAALLETKKKGMMKEIKRSGVMQLDFDYSDIQEYDVEELKRAVFSLPFVAFCSLSASGKGFYALVQIAESFRLNEYAEHCFDVLLNKYGIKADTTKGRNATDLRFVSYDSKFLLRENPTPLLIKRFKQKQAPKRSSNTNYSPNTKTYNSALLNKELKALNEVVIGNRWGTVQKISYTLGGLEDHTLLSEIKNCIKNNSAFAGEEDKYFDCAEICFKEGMARPLKGFTSSP